MTVRYAHGIPIVDVSAARGDGGPGLDDLVGALGEVCRGGGFCYVENHGIPDDVIRTTHAQTVAFFDLPAGDKAELHIAKSKFHRGYFPEGEENARRYPHADLKEGFEMALERTLEDPHVIAGTPLHGPNAWPSVLPRFRPAMLGMFDAMRALGDAIAGVLALAMGQPRAFFADKTDDPLAQLRIVRYPPQPYVPADAMQRVGSGPHTDYGILSIIWQIDAPGLEIQAPGGAWIAAPPVPGAFICMLGDAMQIFTNDVWKAPIHRVVNATDRLRHTLVYFHDPNYHCRIAPLPAFVTPERAARHGETTMGALVMSGFDDAYAYRGWRGQAG